MAAPGIYPPTTRERVTVPPELRLTVARLSLRVGHGRAREMLGISPSVIDELVGAEGRIMPRTLAKVRERLAELGELGA